MTAAWPRPRWNRFNLRVEPAFLVEFGQRDMLRDFGTPGLERLALGVERHGLVFQLPGGRDGRVGLATAGQTGDALLVDVTDSDCLAWHRNCFLELPETLMPASNAALPGWWSELTISTSAMPRLPLFDTGYSPRAAQRST